MTLRTLEAKLKILGKPLRDPDLMRLYAIIPPRPITNKRMHRTYVEAIRFLMRELESGSLEGETAEKISLFLNALLPFVEIYEKEQFSIDASTPEEMLKFLMDQHDLSQYDLAGELGGQPVVSDILKGKRRLTREHIERLSQRFHISPASFYPPLPYQQAA